MFSSISASSLCVILFLMLVQIALSTNPLVHFCSTSEGNFTTNSIYGQNLNKLIGNLNVKTPPTGFGQSFAGHFHTRAHGLSLCRGDISTNDCKACVIEASSEIRKICPNDKGATIWYDNCLLKYSSVDFFGRIDKQETQFYNTKNVSNPKSFNAKVKRLLVSLSIKASAGPRLFAGGDESQEIYGMVQCTRDLSNVTCKACLDSAISELPNCCDGKLGGRVVGGSCNFRYEISPFLSS